MSPHAKQMFWQQTVQSARLLTTDLGSAIEVIDARHVLFIQDGGTTAPAYYDGFESGHVRGQPFETPIGGPMAWVGDRLWIAYKNFVRASDISNPFSFREDIYLGGISAFVFKSEVTALSKTPALENQQLLVFTDTNAELLKAYIRDRSSWPTTDNFQAEVFNIGSVGQRSMVLHFGRLSWFSHSGVVMLDSAQASQVTSRVPIRDNEMMVSKTQLSDDLSLVAGAAFGSYLLMSVPSEDLYNKHTWVLNDASIETVNDDSGASWASYWMGTRPVEWVYGHIVGQDRIYHVSKDVDGENRLWEAFRPERLDNECPITWSVETRGYFGQTSEKKPPGEVCRFGWAEVAFVGVEENFDIGIFYAGGLRGAYKPVLIKQLSVERGNLMPEFEILATTKLFGFKPQSRVERTEEASQKSMDEETGSCPVESPNNEDIDESFQVLIVCHGPAAIRWIRARSIHESVPVDGDNDACINEVPFNAIRFDGKGVHADDRVAVVDQISAKAIRLFMASKTAVVSQGGFTAIGVGSAESVVSQAAADRVALCVATKFAEAELAIVLPKIFSIGEGL